MRCFAKLAFPERLLTMTTIVRIFLRPTYLAARTMDFVTHLVTRIEIVINSDSFLLAPADNRFKDLQSLR